MKFLVTGGTGFIGSNIVERLVHEGYEVTVIDNMHTGSEKNLEAVKAKVKVLKGNVGDVLEKLNEKFDGVFHNGIYSSSPMYKENPKLVAMAIEDFIAVMEYAKKTGAKIVFASTSSLYSGIDPPHKEDAQPKIFDFYTEVRVVMERLAELYNKLYNVRVIGLRYFSVYGPHEEAKGKYANLITQFLWAMRKGETPIIYGDGSQKRDFTYVDDVVKANLLTMNSSQEFGVFNVGTGKTITLNGVVALLNKKLSKSIGPKHIENPIKNYVPYTQADTTKAEHILGFKAETSLDSGIDLLLRYYKL